MAWRILVFFSLVFVTLAITLRNDVGSLFSYILTLIFAGGCMAYLHLRKNPDPLFVIGSISGSVIAQTSTWFVIGATHYVDFVWITICSLLAYLGTNRKFANGLLTANAIGVGYFVFFVYNDQTQEMPILDSFELTGAYLELLLSFFVLGYLMYQFMGFQKVWEMAYQETNKVLQEQNETVKKQNLENIILLKEIHHRVKNNLQIIISLLRLQKNELKSEESRIQFQEAINRVMVMSSIHQKLYQQESLNQLNLEQYLRELIDELIILFKNQKTVTIDLNCTFNAIGLKTIVPVGLLINELLSNSLKYAFINSESGKVTITVSETENGFTISYHDNGVWQPEKEKKGFGLELIEIFTEQLNGVKRFRTDDSGTSYIFELKLAE